jgi:hypothetical protein
MKLSEHFSLEEMTYSDTARSNGIPNTPGPRERLALANLCQKILEPVRERFGLPITVTSGYRSEALNRAVGGSRTSQHMTGDAADIVCRSTTNSALFRLMEQMVRNGEIEVGQLIWEGGTAGTPAWIHVSNPREGKKNGQVLYMF